MAEMRDVHQALPIAASNRGKINESQGRLDEIPDAEVVISTRKGPGVRERSESSTTWLDQLRDLQRKSF